jgi:class 3 adenylate cyclase
VSVPATRYATTVDGLAVAYQVFGNGPPDFVWVPGFASHVELFWDLPGYAHTYRRIAGFTRFAVFDKRGTGLSDRSLGTGTPEERMQDILAVMDAAGFDSAVILGASEGAALSTLFAATYPQRVEALIMLGGAVSGDWVQPWLVPSIERDWGTGRLLRQLWLNGAGDLELLGRIERSMGSPRAMAEQMRHNRRYDGTPTLASIQAPTLVLHVVDDPIVPLASGRELAARIPGARLVELPGAFHGSNLPAEMDRYVDEVEEFVTGQRGGVAVSTERFLSTVLFTDIVDSTGRAAALGDERWTRLLDEHDRVARTAVSRFRGRVVTGTGDGLLAIFDGPARAIAAADAIRRNLEPFGLRLRAGVHTGEIELRGDDVGGIAVHLAARIAAVAQPDETWVSPTVPGLVVGSGLHFADRGDHELKGVPGSWRLAAVETPPR